MSQIAVTAINHATLNASDPVHALKWYQDLFGLPIVARQGNTVVLRVGDGPQFLAINGKACKEPGFAHYCLATDDFNAEQFAGILREHGLTQAPTPGPMQFSIINRGSERGGAPEGTAEVFFGDPDGIVVQVQDSKYCGGAGLLGDICYKTPEPAPSKGLLRIREINHITSRVSHGPDSIAFYQKLFKLPIDTYQGSETPVLRVGSGNASIVLYDVSKMEGVKPGIDHTCFIVDDFDGDRIVKVLTEYGLEPLGEAFRPTGPSQVYYTERMPDRGGDPHGTFELYFTDPDGNVLQLQDGRYCGGCGSLGSIHGTVDHPVGR